MCLTRGNLDSPCCPSDKAAVILPISESRPLYSFLTLVFSHRYSLFLSTVFLLTRILRFFVLFFKMKLNLTQCGIAFASGNYPNYTYNGTIRGMSDTVEPRPPVITVQGCKDLCGEVPQYYSWDQVSSTITTWVSLFFTRMQSAIYASHNARYCRSLASFYRRLSRAT